jgi:hypothetical protein
VQGSGDHSEPPTILLSEGQKPVSLKFKWSHSQQITPKLLKFANSTRLTLSWRSVEPLSLGREKWDGIETMITTKDRPCLRSSQMQKILTMELYYGNEDMQKLSQLWGDIKWMMKTG